MASKSILPDRSDFTTHDTIAELWAHLSLPKNALSTLSLPNSDEHSLSGLPSSFKICHLAQSSIALSALTASLFHSLRNNSQIPKVTVPLLHACLEFNSEKLYTLDGEKANFEGGLGLIGPVQKTADGYVRIHDGFPHHVAGALQILGLPLTATREEINSALLKKKSIDLETAAMNSNCVIAALRSYEKWDALPQAQFIPDIPIQLTKLSPGVPVPPPQISGGVDRCLRGIRVLELSRVIAAPVAGRTLAAHGADVLWITSPNLPDIPAVDRDLARGKRTIQLDLTTEQGKSKLIELVKSADVFIQGYRPGSLAPRGFSPSELVKMNPNIVYANMSAYGNQGPWGRKRGFDSIVQTGSGMNISEAEHFGGGEPARPMPCQALDHASGYLLATGICAALYKRAIEGGSYEVDVSLAGTMKYLRSLGQFPGKTGFDCRVPDEWEIEAHLETRMSGFGELKALKHSAAVEGYMPGWDFMPKPLGSDEPEWL
ncbi:CoA-transferase family III domain-containing protein [Leptodontidium sp. MPI-SDFR-AT-0119]|nr:CoA-transferase family III domain-containing protein [Leptodontidium sp. MPI-SDFR-AT-0119]